MKEWERGSERAHCNWFHLWLLKGPRSLRAITIFRTLIGECQRTVISKKKRPSPKACHPWTWQKRRRQNAWFYCLGHYALYPHQAQIVNISGKTIWDNSLLPKSISAHCSLCIKQIDSPWVCQDSPWAGRWLPFSEHADLRSYRERQRKKKVYVTLCS